MWLDYSFQRVLKVHSEGSKGGFFLLFFLTCGGFSSNKFESKSGRGLGITSRCLFFEILGQIFRAGSCMVRRWEVVQILDGCFWWGGGELFADGWDIGCFSSFGFPGSSFSLEGKEVLLLLGFMLEAYSIWSERANDQDFQFLLFCPVPFSSLLLGGRRSCLGR